MATFSRDQFASFIRAWLDDHGMTAAELAERAQLAPSTLSNWLQGADVPIEVHDLFRLARATDTLMDDWIIFT